MRENLFCTTIESSSTVGIGTASEGLYLLARCLKKSRFHKGNGTKKTSFNRAIQDDLEVFQQFDTHTQHHSQIPDEGTLRMG